MAKTTKRKAKQSIPRPNTEEQRRAEQFALRRRLRVEAEIVKLAKQLTRAVARADASLLELGGRLMGRAATFERGRRAALPIADAGSSQE